MAKKNFEKGLEKLFSNVQSSEPTEEKEQAPVKDDSAADELTSRTIPGEAARPYTIKLLDSARWQMMTRLQRLGR